MTGPEHYKEAERLLSTDVPSAASNTAKAQVHALLALTAAHVMTTVNGEANMPQPDRAAWFKTVGTGRQSADG